MVDLPDFAAVKEYTGQLLADGIAQSLVPFGERAPAVDGAPVEVTSH